MVVVENQLNVAGDPDIAKAFGVIFFFFFHEEKIAFFPLPGLKLYYTERGKKNVDLF